MVPVGFLMFCLRLLSFCFMLVMLLRLLSFHSVSVIFYVIYCTEDFICLSPFRHRFGFGKAKYKFDKEIK